MKTLRRASERGHFDHGWLDTFHTFSFGGYQDPDHMGFRALRVLNEDRVQPGQGFGTHGHRDMEILSWVLAGALEHRDSLGRRGGLRPGEAQVMSAGTGIRHSEFNASDRDPVHFLQIWFLPERGDLPPRYDQAAFPEAELRNRWGLVAGSAGSGAPLRLCQEVTVRAARLDPGMALDLAVPPGRSAYLQVALGAARLGDLPLAAGDGVQLVSEPTLRLEATAPAEFLWFDLA